MKLNLGGGGGGGDYLVIVPSISETTIFAERSHKKILADTSRVPWSLLVTEKVITLHPCCNPSDFCMIVLQKIPTIYTVTNCSELGRSVFLVYFLVPSSGSSGKLAAASCWGGSCCWSCCFNCCNCFSWGSAGFGSGEVGRLEGWSASVILGYNIISAEYAQTKMKPGFCQTATNIPK